VAHDDDLAVRSERLEVCDNLGHVVGVAGDAAYALYIISVRCVTCAATSSDSPPALILDAMSVLVQEKVSTYPAHTTRAQRRGNNAPHWAQRLRDGDWVGDGQWSVKHAANP
jgi:hypothetical protein